MKTVRVQIDDREVEYQVDADTAFGGPEVLLESDDDLLAGTPFAERGFVVAPFLDDAAFARLADGVRQLFCAALSRVLGVSPDPSFAWEQYHRVVTDDEHARLVQATGLHWLNQELPVPMAVVEERVSEILGVGVAAVNPSFDIRHFQVRVVRPGKPDNNPPHRDVWLDRLRHGVNLYAPLAGSNRHSSLPILPGSHRWRESEIERSVEGAVVDGVRYTVPAVTGTRRPFRLERPRVGTNEVMIFTPYAIHGGGVNLNADITRVSLEIRFWRKT